MSGLAEEPLDLALRWSGTEGGASLATVIATWGSSPRPAGSQMAVERSGRFAGSVSGGCIEGAVIEEALAVMDSGEPSRLEFGVSDERAWSVGLACGGRVEVYVESLADPDRRAGLERLRAERLARRPVARVLDLGTGAQRVVGEAGPLVGGPLAAATAARVAEALRRDRVEVLETDAGSVLIHPVCPVPRLFVVGAVHIAQSLAPMARMLGYDVTVIDPRRAFADEARFEGVRVLADWPDEALAGRRLDRRAALVTLSHDPKIDDPALEAALAGEPFYVGALGSRRTHATRLERLRARGWSEAALARINGPVGLDIGAVSPAEIAVSVLAQITAALRAPEAGS